VDWHSLDLLLEHTVQSWPTFGSSAHTGLPPLARCKEACLHWRTARRRCPCTEGALGSIGSKRGPSAWQCMLLHTWEGPHLPLGHMHMSSGIGEVVQCVSVRRLVSAHDTSRSPREGWCSVVATILGPLSRQRCVAAGAWWEWCQGVGRPLRPLVLEPLCMCWQCANTRTFTRLQAVRAYARSTSDAVSQRGVGCRNACARSQSHSACI